MPDNKDINKLGEKPEDVRILGQIQAEILALNDKCPDEGHRALMRTMILSATKLLLYRLRELYADNQSR